MDEDPIVTQMGLLFTEVKSVRRTLEGIERAVTRSMPLSLLAGAGSAVAALGAPPLFEGSLKVYVVNISDLVAEGGGLLDVLGGIFGGVGRFLGGLVGGAVGGTAAGVLLVLSVKDIATIASSADHILTLLNTKPDGSSQSTATETLGDQLKALKGLLLDIKGLFVTANDDKGGASKDLAASLNPVVQALLGASRVITGLVVLIPMAVGAIAWLFHHLPDFMKSIAETVAFAFRMVLVLRAAALAVILDTIAVAVKLVSEVLPLLQKGLTTILEAVFELIKAIVTGFMRVLEAIGPGLKTFAETLMEFIRDGIGGLLTAIGQSVLIRFLVGFAAMLPGLTSALVGISGTTLTKDQQDALDEARKAAKALPSGSGPTAAPPIVFPDLSKAFDATIQKKVTDALDKTKTDATTATNNAFNAARDALVDSGKKINDTLEASNSALKGRIDERVGEANSAAAGLGTALKGLPTSKGTGPFADVAAAYETWFKGDGMTKVLDDFAARLKAEAAVQGAKGPLPGSVDFGRATGKAELVVDIDKVVIDLVAPMANDPSTTVLMTAPGAPTTLPVDGKTEQKARGAGGIGHEMICR